MNKIGDVMLRSICLIFLLCGFAVACSPSAEEPVADQIAESESQVEEHEEELETDGEEAEHEEGDEHREHGAHEHGVALLTVAWSGSEIVMELETPAFNVLGFEHAPSTTAEEELLAESVAMLQEGNLLQILAADAECTLSDAVVNTTIGEDEHEHEEEGEAEHEEEEGEVHSDIDVSYTFQCQNPEQIEMVDAGELFAQFPNFEELEVQWVSDTQQSSAELTPDNPIVTLE
jgi:hypothetical protein